MNALRSTGFIDALFGDFPTSSSPDYLSGYYAGLDARLSPLWRK